MNSSGGWNYMEMLESEIMLRTLVEGHQQQSSKAARYEQIQGDLFIAVLDLTQTDLKTIFYQFNKTFAKC